MSLLQGTTIERLQRGLGRPMAPDVAADQRAAIGEAVADAPQPVSPVRPHRSGGHGARIAASLAAAVLVIVVLGTGVASQAAVPGEVLYPVKRALEPIQSWWNEDVVPEHRVGEVIVLIERDAAPSSIADALEDALRSVATLPPDHPQRLRLDAVTSGATRPATPTTPEDPRGGQVPPSSDRDTSQVDGRSTTTTTDRNADPDEPRERDATDDRDLGETSPGGDGVRNEPEPVPSDEDGSGRTGGRDGASDDERRRP